MIASMLTFIFRELDESQIGFLSGQVGETCEDGSEDGLLHDLLRDNTAWYALVEESKAAQFHDFLEHIGVDIK